MVFLCYYRLIVFLWTYIKAFTASIDAYSIAFNCLVCDMEARFLARESIYVIARYMLSPVRLSVCPSHGWISQKRLKLGSRNFRHRVAPWL